MKGLIAALWRGEVRPDMCSGLDNADLKRAEAELERCRKRLEEILTEEQERVLMTYLSSLEHYINERDEQVFHDGFSLGVNMTSEALLDAEKMK
jgi:hypothetical protein